MGSSDKLLHHSDQYSTIRVSPRLYKSFGEKIMENSSLHLPITSSVPARELNLGNPESLEFFSGILSSARDYGMRTSLLHPCTVYYQPTPENLQAPQKIGLVWNKKRKKEARRFLQRTLELAERFPEWNFAYETLLFPIAGDIYTEPDKVTIEPNFITTQSIDSFLKNTKGRKINLCLDVAHYLITRETLNAIKRNSQSLKQNSYLRTLVGSLSQEQGEGITPDFERAYEILNNLRMPSLINFVRQHYQRITDVQIADTKGAWTPSINGNEGELIQEGCPLIKGLNFYDEIMGAFYTIKNNATARDVAVSFDIAEDDYKNRKNQERTLEIVLGIQFIFSFITLAGIPITVVLSKTSLVTTAPAPTMHLSPIFNFGRTIAPEPI